MAEKRPESRFSAKTKPTIGIDLVRFPYFDFDLAPGGEYFFDTRFAIFEPSITSAAVYSGTVLYESNTPLPIAGETAPM